MKTSRTLSEVSNLAERTFWRLITTVDDFGRYYGETKALQSACFPIGALGVKDGAFKTALEELERADLIRFYDSDGRRYLYSPTWSKYQRRRASESRFPQPPEFKGRGHLTADVRDSRSSAAVVVVEVEDVVVGGERSSPPPNGSGLERPPEPPEYVLTCEPCRAMLNALNESTARCYGAPGRSGVWMHMAHQGRQLPEVLAVIRRQVTSLIRSGKTRFLAPSVLFKPENWDTSVNDRPMRCGPDELEGL